MVVVSIIAWLLLALQTVVLVHAVLSWVQVRPDNPVAVALSVVCEPLLAPIRQVLPSAGGLDFSPLVAIILLQFLRAFVIGLG